MLFCAVLDLLEFLVLAEFSEASFNHVEEFVDVLQKPCEFSTDLSGVQFQSELRTGLRLIRFCKKWEGRALGPSNDLLFALVVCVLFDFYVVVVP